MPIGAFKTGLMAAAGSGAAGFVAFGGLITQYVHSGTTYRVHTFRGSGRFYVASGEATVSFYNIGGGGAGGPNGNTPLACKAGGVNTGGGGGGVGYTFCSPVVVGGGYGGSGVVILRFPDAATLSVSPGTNTTAPAPGCTKVANFTVSGTLTVAP